tara:strand:+ start:7625 stop:7999 length:375 start_codon:yes stop_codon:yes gene_type:complete
MESKSPYTYNIVEVTKVIDADTIRVVLDLGFHLRFNATCRLYGINAYETRGPEKTKGKAAAEFLEGLLEGAELFCVTHKEPRKQQGKYGRWLIELFAKRDGCSINCNRELVRRGHAVTYMSDIR